MKNLQPKRIQNRFETQCKQCQGKCEVGDVVIYFPKTKSIICESCAFENRSKVPDLKTNSA